MRAVLVDNPKPALRTRQAAEFSDYEDNAPLTAWLDRARSVIPAEARR